MPEDIQNPAASAPQEGTNPIPQPEGAATSASSGAKRILIVEDERPLSHALQVKLKHEGYEVVVAANGEEGLEKTLAEEFDLLLVDIIMPKMDGFTMINKIKEAGKTTKIIILSNLGQQEDIDKANGLGITQYLVKSNTPISTIVEVINSTLSS